MTSARSRRSPCSTQLRQLDEVAYLRFASVYKNFDAAADFHRELELLEKAAVRASLDGPASHVSGQFSDEPSG